MYCVVLSSPADVEAEVSTHRACWGLRWVGGANHPARRLDHVQALPHLCARLSSHISDGQLVDESALRGVLF